MHRFFVFSLYLGIFGPLILGVLDSSFLVLPFGNDLLLVILIARKHEAYPWYVLMAAVGSTAGVFLLDLVSRKGGDEGLRMLLTPKRYDYLEGKMRTRAGTMIALACVAPPPFPFTAVLAAASAFQYPQKRELVIVFVMRMVRFSLVGIAAILLGRSILRIARSGPFYWAMVAFIVVWAAGSAYSVYGWIKRSQRAPAPQRA